MTRRVCVIPGDDAAPEAVLPSLRVLQAMEPGIEFVELPDGQAGRREHGDRWNDVCIEAIEATDTTLFGSSSGATPAIGYLRYGKDTYANVRPTRYLPGAESPLRNPEGIDFVIVRENTEDVYTGIEGDLSLLTPLKLTSRRNNPLPESGGRFAIKVITEEKTRRVVEFAFRLAQRRKDRGHRGSVISACKWNVLPQTDGLFRDVAAEVASEYHDIEYTNYLADDFARRIVATPLDLDVVVLPNLYGDILSDEAAALVGGLGLAPSACYGDDFAYFEPVHGTAPDIMGAGTINPTATLLSAAMMLDHLELGDAGDRLVGAIEAVFADGSTMTPDQGGDSTAEQFCDAVIERL
ncbi:MAG: isocitrate/isopropylmalate family dehydrogenase [Dehalococcoidia bacterium]|jgi:isocitrate/isopropylmalate dehydrogenase|nr:isocitrate/isopropylmalate family dehydrogenase [Dehalococcoidia bacterium]